MKILIIPSWYIGENSKNKGSFFRDQALALGKKHEVILMDVTLQSKKDYFSKKNFHLRRYRDNTFEVYSFTIPSFRIWRNIKLCNLISYALANHVMKKILKDGHTIDVIHAHSYYPAGYISCELGKKYNIPVAVTEHSGSVAIKDLRTEEIELLTKVTNSSNAFICVSEKLKNSVLEITKTKKRITVIPNMVSDLFRYFEIPKTKNFNFISIGNLVDSKKHLKLCQLFYEEFKNQKEVRLSIIGEGPCYGELNRFIKEKRMDSQICLLGTKTHKEVLEYLKASNCLVLLSDYESFGIVYIEALAVGRPVIGTKNGGANDIINCSNGYLVDKDDLLIKKAFKEMVDKYSNYNLAEISKCTLDKYSEIKIIELLVKVYDIIIKENN